MYKKNERRKSEKNEGGKNTPQACKNCEKTPWHIHRFTKKITVLLKKMRALPSNSRSLPH
jgi:hypothetical protein